MITLPSILSYLFRIAFALSLATVCSRSVAAADIHVDPQGDDRDSGSQNSPVQSLAQALSLARETPEADTIQLRGGALVKLDEPLRLDARDSGLQIVCREGTVTLSGGVEVEQWREDEDGNWRAESPVEGDVRELFINGRRATRARFPDEGWLRIEQSLPDRRSGFLYKSDDLPGWLEPGKGLELVFLHDWSISRIEVSSIDHENRTLKTAHPIGSAAPHYAIDHFEKQPRYALEGAPRLIDSPGEWAIDGKELVYRPLYEERLDELSARVPRLQQLLKIAPGEDEQQRPENIRFENITFAHCRFDVPSNGYASGQATMHDRRDGSDRGGRIFIPAAVRITQASGIEFIGCSFRQLGGSGIWIGKGSRDCRIEASRFVDISGNGINLGEPDTENVARDIALVETEIRECGAQYFGSVGVWIGMAEGCSVEQCEIHHLPYTGVSVGWRWNPTPSPCKRHRIANNHIHHVMQVLSDGGGIYTLGRQPGTVLQGNHIHDVPLNAGRAQSNGIFMDEGTTEIVVEDNVIHHIAKSPIRFHQARENIIRNNTLGLNEDATPFTFNATDSELITFENNLELSDAEVSKLPLD